MIPRTRSLFLSLILISVLAACSTAGSPSGSAAGPGSTATAAASGATCGGQEGAEYEGWPTTVAPDAAKPVPILVSQDLAVGPQRLLVTLRGPGNEPVAARDLPVRLSLFALARDPQAPQATVDGVFLDPGAGKAGIYRFAAEFSCAGEWGLEVTLRPGTGQQASQRLRFDVPPTSSTPAIGAAVPAIETPTGRTSDEIKRISSDPTPDPDFYRRSLKQAVEQKKPFLVAFSTPLFCQNALCGPTLDVVKRVAEPYTERVELVHVEPYQLKFEDGQVQPVLGRYPNEPAENPPHLLPVEAVQAWGLRTEPYVFVVDSQGRLAAKFEGVLDEAELRAALERVAS